MAKAKKISTFTVKVSRKQQRTYELHRDVHGPEHVNRLLDQLCEEAGELIVAAQHFKRGRFRGTIDDPLGKVIDEFADVLICGQALLYNNAELRHRLSSTTKDKIENLFVRLVMLRQEQCS